MNELILITSIMRGRVTDQFSFSFTYSFL